MVMTVITYGAGEILEQVFNAIAMLINGKSNGILRPLLVLGASIGGFWAISKALIFPSYEGLLTRFVFPLLCTSTVLLIPTTTIRIEDIIKNQSYTVDHVPFLLARFAELVSSIGYKVTTSIETIMHVPKDMSYNATGMIFGSDTALDVTKYKLTNAVLEQDLRRFSKQCVLYDVALDRYSVDDLKKSSDLWKLFEEKTSNVRMINYCDPNSKTKCMYVSCKEAVQKMKPFFDKETKYYAGLDILGNLPLTFQALTGLQNDKEKLIGQQLVMNLLAREYNGDKFAKARADSQNQNTLQLVGSMASSSLLSMRNVFEALIYIGFIFVLPLSVAPGGFTLIINWTWLLIWIQMWPPLYAVLNYIIQITAQSKSAAIFVGLAADQIGLSFFTNMGLQNLQNNMMGATNFLFASVPVISYMFLKGGIHAFSNIASSMMSPMQNAASAAAAEQATGNYSFANASFGQMSYQSTNGFQHNLAPSVSDGYFTDHQGNSTKIYGADENILQQNMSRLRTSVSADKLISEGVQINEQQAQSLVGSTSKTYLESLSNHSKRAADLSEHFGNSQNYNESFCAKEGYSIQESASYLQNTAENWGKQYGFNAKESMEALASASVGGEIGFGRWISTSARASGNYSVGASKDDMVSSAISVATSSGFQSHLQKINDFAMSKNFSDSQDEGARFVTSYANSLDNLKSSQISHQASLSNLHQVSENSSWMKQNSHLIRQSLDQDFVNWAQERFEDSGGLDQVDKVLLNGTAAEKQTLFNDFSKAFNLQPHSVFSASESLQTAYQDSSVKLLNSEDEWKQISHRSIQKLQDNDNSKLYKWDLNTQKDSLSSDYSHSKSGYQTSSESLSSKIQTDKEEAVQQIDTKNEEYLVGRTWNHLFTQKDLSNKYRVVEKPIWMEE